jgi:hypothetical protein
MGCLSGRRLWCVMASVWLWVAPTGAEVEPRPYVDLKYEVDPALQDCPNVLEFRDVVAQKLGYDPYRPGSTLGVDVRVVPTATGLAGTLAWRTTGDGQVQERLFSSGSGGCHEIVATMAFVVAVQVQLASTESAAEVEPQSADAGPVTLAQSPPTRLPMTSGKQTAGGVRSSVEGFKVVTLPIPPTTSRSVVVGGGPLVGFGLGPETVALGRLFVALEHGPAVFELATVASLPATHLSSGGGFEYRLMSASVAACGRYHSVLACGLANLGCMQVQGFGVDDPASPRGFVAQVGPRLGYVLSLGEHLLLHGHFEGLYSLTPWTVDLDGMDVWAMPRLSVVAGLDLGVRFR